MMKQLSSLLGELPCLLCEARVIADHSGKSGAKPTWHQVPITFAFMAQTYPQKEHIGACGRANDHHIETACSNQYLQTALWATKCLERRGGLPWEVKNATASALFAASMSTRAASHCPWPEDLVSSVKSPTLSSTFWLAWATVPASYTNSEVMRRDTSPA